MAVNEDQLQLLHLLKTTDHPLSGEGLARQLGISRVGLWKRMESLRAAGYQIEAGRSGYRLIDRDLPLPWEFPGQENLVSWYDSLDSTMDVAFRQALDGCPEGSMVLAGRQNAGRGQAGRPWASPEGNLYFTLTLRPDLPVTAISQVTWAGLTCLARVLHQLYGLTTVPKQPNDLLAGGAKLAGILTETAGTADRARFFNLGVGLNLVPTAVPDRPTAALNQLIGPKPDRRAICAAFSRDMLLWSRRPDNPLPAWQE